jgi:hypothetical protein
MADIEEDAEKKGRKKPYPSLRKLARTRDRMQLERERKR